MRRRGFSFKQAWPVAQHRALRHEDAYTASWWRGTWREQWAVWQANFSRTAWPSHRRPALDTIEHEHRDTRDSICTIVA
jgi:hypothetical protein